MSDGHHIMCSAMSRTHDHDIACHGKGRTNNGQVARKRASVFTVWDPPTRTPIEIAAHRQVDLKATA
jgi:hypothetical protein